MSPALSGTSNALERMIVVEETLPSGMKVWVATDMDLDGCIAQGDSEPEAKAALIEARRDYAYVQKMLQLTPSQDYHVSSGAKKNEGVYVFPSSSFCAR